MDGVHREPPVTPIGRDELALKRHRFFAELLAAAQAATDHRVRFNPLGPDFAFTDNFGNFLGRLMFILYDGTVTFLQRTFRKKTNYFSIESFLRFLCYIVCQVFFVMLHKCCK